MRNQQAFLNLSVQLLEWHKDVGEHVQDLEPLRQALDGVLWVAMRLVSQLEGESWNSPREWLEAHGVEPLTALDISGNRVRVRCHGNEWSWVEVKTAQQTLQKAGLPVSMADTTAHLAGVLAQAE